LLLTRDKIQRKKYNVLRIWGPNTIRFRSSSADIVPISVLGTDPTLEGKVLAPRTMTHITEGVEVKVEGGSIIDLLVIISAKK